MVRVSVLCRHVDLLLKFTMFVSEESWHLACEKYCHKTSFVSFLAYMTQLQSCFN